MVAQITSGPTILGITIPNVAGLIAAGVECDAKLASLETTTENQCQSVLGQAGLQSARDELQRAEGQEIMTINAEIDAAIRTSDLEVQRAASVALIKNIRAEGLLLQIETEEAELAQDQAKLQTSVQDMQKALIDLSKRKTESDTRINEFKSLLARFKSLIDAGKLRVKIVDGRMVVELATDILFGSGSAQLSPDGKLAIAEVAAVLASIPDRRFQVEGHTDNVPIKTAQYPSNWELAAARSVTVVKSLVDAGLPATLDVRSDKVGFKIREAHNAKLPYIAVVGERDAANGTVALRRKDSETPEVLSVADFVARVVEDARRPF